MTTPEERDAQDPWIQTFTGKAFSLLNPRLEDIDIADIAHSLAHQCRFGGHCSVFYSVAQHSIELAKELMIRWPQIRPLHQYGLLHDAAEAYLLDLPRPLKSLFPQYRSMESTISELIQERFGLKFPPDIALSYRGRVKEVDMCMLATERDIMSKCTSREWSYPPKGVKAISRGLYPFLLPNDAEQKFLEFATILGVI